MKITYLFIFLLFAGIAAAQNIEVSIEVNSNYVSEINQSGYGCAYNPSADGNPVYGLVFAGTDLLRTSQNSDRIEIEQKFQGNNFLIPVTIGGCSTIKEKFPRIKDFTNSFVSFINMKYLVEMVLFYPNLDIVGDFSRSGSFSVVFTKNETNPAQIFVRPR